MFFDLSTLWSPPPKYPWSSQRGCRGCCRGWRYLGLGWIRSLTTWSQMQRDDRQDGYVEALRSDS